MLRIIGIYKIQSKIKPDRIYIGSAVKIIQRWSQHLCMLSKGNHHSIKLQRHYDKYGKEDLEFSILLTCEKESLLKLEQFYMDSYKPYFNIKLIAERRGFSKGTGGRKPGFTHSEETKNKISRKLFGRKLSEAAKNSIRNGKIGKPSASKGKKRKPYRKIKNNESK